MPKFVVEKTEKTRKIIEAPSAEDAEGKARWTYFDEGEECSDPVDRPTYRAVRELLAKSEPQDPDPLL
jgi:hypothetical protein